LVNLSKELDVKMFKLFLVAASVFVGFAVHAQSSHGPNDQPFTLDSSGAVLIGSHPNDTNDIIGFADSFLFYVSGPSQVSGFLLLPGVATDSFVQSLVQVTKLPAATLQQVVLPLILATPGAVAIFDLSSPQTPLESSADSKTFFAVKTNLPKTGFYDFVAAGTVGAGSSGLYVAYVVAQAVPEPSTCALALVGLGAVGWVARRRRNGVTAA
jgi:hypothetical protein